MLAHGNHLWPEVVTKALWPFALKAACRTRNRYKLNDDNLSPLEIMSGVKMKAELKNEHPLFCPVFVLDRNLQNHIGGLPKWNPRANAGVYLGHSPDHASNVALVLNINTGCVSPQYHVVFDDDFSTVDYIRSKKEPSNWEHLCKHHTEDYRMHAMPNEPTLESLDWDLSNSRENNSNLHQSESVSSDPASTNESQVSRRPSELTHNSSSSNTSLRDSSQASADPSIDFNTDDDQLPTNSQEGEETPIFNNSSDTVSEGANSSVDQSVSATEGEASASASPLRRSSRIRKKVDRLTASRLGNLVNESMQSALGYISAYLIEIKEAPEYCYVAFKARVEHKIVAHVSKRMQSESYNN